MEGYQQLVFNNFKELFESDTQLAMRLVYRLGLEHCSEDELNNKYPWASRELVVYPTEYDFGLYQLQDGLYKVFNFADNDYGSLRDPLDFIDMNLFGERLAEDFDDEGDRYLHVGDCVIESPYGFR